MLILVGHIVEREKKRQSVFVKNTAATRVKRTATAEYSTTSSASEFRSASNPSTYLHGFDEVTTSLWGFANYIVYFNVVRPKQRLTEAISIDTDGVSQPVGLATISNKVYFCGSPNFPAESSHLNERRVLIHNEQTNKKRLHNYRHCNCYLRRLGTVRHGQWRLGFQFEDRMGSLWSMG